MPGLYARNLGQGSGPRLYAMALSYGSGLRLWATALGSVVDRDRNIIPAGTAFIPAGTGTGIKNKIPAGTGIRVIPTGTGTGNFASKIEPFLTYRTITTFHEFMQFEIIHVRYI